jgi:hypothetical protein
MRKRLRRIFLVVGLCGLAVFLLDTPTIMWVGDTALTVEFAVTNAENGAPVPAADVLILAVGGSNADTEEVKLTTNGDGITRHVGRNCMCCGQESTLRFTNTYSVYLPHWSVVVRAEGYEAQEFYLETTANRRAIERTGPRQANLVVPIALHKVQSQR